MQEIDTLPKALKILMLFIDRVGFPILAFILMFYMSITGLQKITNAMENTTKTLVELTTHFMEFQKQVTQDHCAIIDNQKEIQNDLKVLRVK